MYRKIEDFEQTWARESESTLKVLRALTDESLAQPVADGHQTLGGLAWHLTVALTGIAGQMGLPVDGPERGMPMPSAAEIAAAYEAAARSVAEEVRECWTDELIAEPVPFFGRETPAGVALTFLVLHQTHHRGQMTVLMRQAGLKVPGMYGPAKEEMDAMIAAAKARAGG
ncbi:MAG: dinB family protein [Gemmatimonadetes bacterium]|nr:dinB family protein [Gemmatimonadota bacterium]